MRCLGLRGSSSLGISTCAGPAGETCIMRMTQEASMSISFQELAPIVRFVMVLLQAPNRRAGPLDMSGIMCVWWTSTRVLDVSVSEVCVCVASSPGLLFSDTWNREPVTGALPLPPQQWQAAGAWPGSRCLGRSTGTGHELPSSLFLYLSLSAVPNQLLCLLPRLPMRSPWALPPLTLVPSQTSQNTSYHLIRFLLGPLRPFQVFDDCQYYHALARISPFGPASFCPPCFFSPFPP